MIQWIIHQIKYFLDQFWRTPSGRRWWRTFVVWRKIIRYECTHFLFSLFLGWVVFSLTLTILSSPRFKEYDHYMWNISFSVWILGLCYYAYAHRRITQHSHEV